MYMCSKYEQCEILESQIKQHMKETKNNPFTVEMHELRNKITKLYLNFLNEEPQMSLDKEILTNMWKFVFYKQIEFVRKDLRKIKDAIIHSKEELKKENNRILIQLHLKYQQTSDKLTEDILPSIKSVYEKLMISHLKLSKIHLNHSCTEIENEQNVYFTDLLTIKKFITEDGSATDADNDTDDSENIIKNENEMKSNEDITHLLLAQKCFTFLGDLERYRATCLESNYSSAIANYTSAVMLDRNDGNPHNQLAVIHTYNGYTLDAIYEYFMALFVDQPFTTAKNNVITNFKINRSKIFQHSNKMNVENMKHLIISGEIEIECFILLLIEILFYKKMDEYLVYKELLECILHQVMQLLSQHSSTNDDYACNECGNDEIADKYLKLVLIGIYVVYDCMPAHIKKMDGKTNENEKFGYLESVSWMLNFISVIMRSVSADNLSLLKPITLGISWLHKNFMIIVPDLNKVPYTLHANTTGILLSNNKLFESVVAMLNVLNPIFRSKHNLCHDKYKYSDPHLFVIPETIKYYGISHLRYFQFDRKLHEIYSHAFFHQRRQQKRSGNRSSAELPIAPQLQTHYSLISSNSSTNKNTTEDESKASSFMILCQECQSSTSTLSDACNCDFLYLRYLQVLYFAAVSAEKVPGVVAYQSVRDEWIFSELLVEDTNKSSAKAKSDITHGNCDINDDPLDLSSHPLLMINDIPLSSNAMIYNRSRSLPSSPNTPVINDNQQQNQRIAQQQQMKHALFSSQMQIQREKYVHHQQQQQFYGYYGPSLPENSTSNLNYNSNTLRVPVTTHTSPSTPREYSFTHPLVPNLPTLDVTSSLPLHANNNSLTPLSTSLHRTLNSNRNIHGYQLRPQLNLGSMSCGASPKLYQNQMRNRSVSFFPPSPMNVNHAQRQYSNRSTSGYGQQQQQMSSFTFPVLYPPMTAAIQAQAHVHYPHTQPTTPNYIHQQMQQQTQPVIYRQPHQWQMNRSINGSASVDSHSMINHDLDAFLSHVVDEAISH